MARLSLFVSGQKEQAPLVILSKLARDQNSYKGGAVTFCC